MLTLTRRVGERIRIGDDVEIVVKEIRKSQIRIGIVAPRAVPVYREEVAERIDAEALQAERERETATEDEWLRWYERRGDGR